MKAIAYLQRRARPRTRPRVSLFPFLAVLVCTMGALVPLILAMNYAARSQAKAEAQARASEGAAQIKADAELAQWRVEQLQNAREKTTAQLADARFELGHLEDHAQRLRTQLANYKETLNDMQRLMTASDQERAQAVESLQQMRTQLAAAEQEVQKARQAIATRQPRYSVVPYEGPNQTRRRPIYLECRADSIVFQPEGVVLTAADFDGPMGPGNPLAIALRAVREHMLTAGRFSPKAGEPYPLLLVRPDGIIAYYAARAAMKSWGFDFGYELIDEDWKLEFPPQDPQLASSLKRVIAAARIEQARLIAAAPRAYPRNTKVTYRASRQGGFVPEVTAVDGDEAGSYAAQDAQGHVGRRVDASGKAAGGYAGDAPYSGDVPYSGVVPGAPAGNTAVQTGTAGAGGVNNGQANGNALANNNAHANGGGLGNGGGNGAAAGNALAMGGSAGGTGGGVAGSSANPYEVVASTGNGNTVGASAGAGLGGGTAAAGVNFANNGMSAGGNANALGGASNGTPDAVSDSVFGSATGGAPGSVASGVPGPAGAMSGGAGQAGTSSFNASGVASGTAMAGGSATSGGNGTTAGGATSGGTEGDATTGSPDGGAAGTGADSGMSGGGASGMVTMGGGGMSSGDCSQQGAGAGITLESGQTASSPTKNKSVVVTPSEEMPDGYVVGQPPREQEPVVAQTPPEGAETEMRPARIMRPGEWEPSPEPPPKKTKKPEDEKDNDHDVDRFGRKREESMAEQRGREWGLRGSTRDAIGVTRQISVQCYADRLILPARNPVLNKEIALGPRTRNSIDTLIGAVWERMDSWGIAGRGMYWRPVLQVEIAPGAEARFADLESLLANSGIAVIKK